MREDSRTDIGRFLGPGSEKKWYGTHTYKPNGKWDRIAEHMMINFRESGHPVFRGSSALERRDLKSKGKGNLSVHFCCDDKIVEVVLGTIISVNQLRINGAVAGKCEELAWDISNFSEGTGRPVAPNDSETMVMPTELSTTNQIPPTDERVQGDLLRVYEQQFANLPYHLQLTKLCSNVGITKTVASGQYFTTLDDAELGQIGRLMSRVYHSSKRPTIQSEKDGFVGTRRSVQYWRWPLLIIKAVTESRSWHNLNKVMEPVVGSWSWME